MEDHRLCNRKLGPPHSFRGAKEPPSPRTTIKQPHGDHPTKKSNHFERGERQSGNRDKA